MSDLVVFVADAGPSAGLGHISRSSAVAVALRDRGVETACYALGLEKPLERDGIPWVPAGDVDTLPPARCMLVVDSYRVSAEVLARAARELRLVLMHDYGTVPRGAALVVSVTGERIGGASTWLTGFRYAALRPGYWGLPSRHVAEHVERILVTTGSEASRMAGAIAEAVAREVPTAEVTLVRGPHSSATARPPVLALEAPESLLGPMLGSDLVITAGGQTLLEAAACGSPCVALSLAENQLGQTRRLADLGAALMVDPRDAKAAAARTAELAGMVTVRRALSRRGQDVVDGYGAHRIAFQIERLLDA